MSSSGRRQRVIGDSNVELGVAKVKMLAIQEGKRGTTIHTIVL